jgi:hypothetical protein
VLSVDKHCAVLSIGFNRSGLIQAGFVVTSADQCAEEALPLSATGSDWR